MNRRGKHSQVLLCLCEIDPHLQIVPGPEAEWLWCSSCLVQQMPQSSYSGSRGHAFLPMYCTCLFTVSLLCLGLRVASSASPACSPCCLIPVCVGRSSTRRELGCFQGQRNLSCLLRQRQLSSGLPMHSILAEWVWSRCSPKLTDCRTRSRHFLSFPAANLSCL